MISTMDLAIATILFAAKVSSIPKSGDIAKRSRIHDDSRVTRSYEKNRETHETEGHEPRYIVGNDKNTWRESSVEELASATGSNGYTGYSIRGNYVNDDYKHNYRQSNGHGWVDAFPGIPGIDYPNHTRIPGTSFTCLDKDPGGYYADAETGCQAFHVCNSGGVKSSFLCPPGSIFDQRYFVCDWWYSFNCHEALDLYSEKLKQNSKDSRQQTPNYPIYEKILTNPIVNKKELQVTPLSGKYLKDTKINDAKPTNRLSLATSSERESSYPRQSSGRNNVQSPIEFDNNARVYSNEPMRAPKSHENRVNSDSDDNAPRGFSRDRDDVSLLIKRNDRDSQDLTNDLASYVNYAYFEARSSNNNVDNETNEKKES